MREPERVTSLRAGIRSHQLPATAAGAETCLLILFLGQRALAVAQLVAALPAALRASTRPWLGASVVCLFLVESAVVAAVAVRRRSYRSRRLAAVDVGTGVLVLLAEAVTVPVDVRFTSWAGWAYPVSLGAAAGAAIALRRAREVVACVLVLVLSYLAVTLVPASSSDAISTSITNALSYIGFAAVLWFIAGYLRRLAQAADDAREAAAVWAAEAERDSHRSLLHDQASVLALLSQPVEEPLGTALRQQAAEGAARIRWFLMNERSPAGPVGPWPPYEAVPSGRVSSGGLRELVMEVCESFSDLPLVVNLDMIERDLPADVTAVVQAAVATLLHNVRRHAQAREVVVHIETGAMGWELVVRDDGVGFDRLSVASGYGLRHLVETAAEAVGGAVAVHSAPEEGTTVRVWGPA